MCIRDSLSIVFLVIHLFIAPGSEEDPQPFERTKSDYVLMLLQCSLGILAMILPSLISRKLRLEIPSVMYVLFLIFLYCAIYLGEVRNFYYDISNWDTILHGFSGAMLGALGFSFVALLNQEDRVPINLSPLFVVIFAFCFAITLGVFWEIYEFSFDGLLGLNMQKAYLEDGTPLAGRMALMDKMCIRDRDNRLCAKEIIGNRANLTKWQDDFHAYMVEKYPALERGEMCIRDSISNISRIFAASSGFTTSFFVLIPSILIGSVWKP